MRENIRARMRRVMVKHKLRKYGYPHDKQEKATLTVLEQSAWLATDWAGLTLDLSSRKQHAALTEQHVDMFQTKIE